MPCVREMAQLMQHYTTTSPMAAIIYNILIFFLYCLIGSIIYTSIEPGWTVADAVYFSAMTCSSALPPQK